MTSSAKNLQVAAWSISSVAVVLAIAAWGQYVHWHIFGTSTYLLFPVFGLIAFSILWSQYITLALRRYYELGKVSLTTYFRVTGYIVLLAILLHPGLLIWQLWRDGLG